MNEADHGPRGDGRRPGATNDRRRLVAPCRRLRRSARGHDRIAVRDQQRVLGIRATRAITRGARWALPPRTYVAGLFGTPGTGPGEPGLIPAADWLQVSVKLPDGPLVHHPGDVTSHRITLDMKRGALHSESAA